MLLRDRAGQVLVDDRLHVAAEHLQGEYDWSVWPERTEELVREVPGAKFQRMEGMGHFPMCENPDAFKRYLIPILNEIASA